jgi:GNAT superfamily N-acetyltransferase
VLRPGRPTRESAYPGDDDPRAAHAVARGPVDGAVLSVGTVVPEAPPWLPAPASASTWRIRGMATTPSERGRGLGTLVLGALLRHVATHGGGLVWCNARIGARTFYERAGFGSRGEVFELPGIGPHTAMWRTVDASGGPGAG